MQSQSDCRVVLCLFNVLLLVHLLNLAASKVSVQTETKSVKKMLRLAPQYFTSTSYTIMYIKDTYNGGTVGIVGVLF